MLLKEMDMLDILMDSYGEGLLAGGEAAEVVSQYHFLARLLFNDIIILLHVK